MNARVSNLLRLRAFCAAFAVGLAASRAEEASAPVIRVGLGTAGEMPANLVDRIASHLDRNLRAEVRVRALNAPAEPPVLRILAATPGLRQQEESCLVILAAEAAPGQPHGFIDPTNRVAIIQVGAMRAEDAEVFGRRLEKQAMRGATFLAGIPSCPNPLCCLFAYTSTEELDMMGRNHCPPCMGQWQRSVHARGFSLKPLPSLPRAKPPPGPGQPSAP